MTRALSTQHSLFSSKVTRGTALNLRKGRRGKRTSSSQPAHAARQQPENKIWFVKVRDDITLRPRCSHILVRKQEREEQILHPLVSVEPAQIVLEGIFTARALTRVGTSTHSTFQMTLQRSHAVNQPSNSAYTMLENFSDELTVPKATILGIAEVEVTSR